MDLKSTLNQKDGLIRTRELEHTHRRISSFSLPKITSSFGHPSLRRKNAENKDTYNNVEDRAEISVENRRAGLLLLSLGRSREETLMRVLKDGPRGIINFGLCKWIKH
ncbi:hypothetical protein TNCT_491831 [Trichonephila clavata]|uniref:Uncharacterized protein n=1 Tax=Trichonephila clavata TaxID=2740835 RepID=A0A8X6L8T4_TRICU|nr:hypothetical protein TNCT_491831 [Trichonephila clavata]